MAVYKELEAKFDEAMATETTRRTVLATGAKLAYAAPLVAAAYRVSEGRVLAADMVPITHEAYYTDLKEGYTEDELAAMAVTRASTLDKAYICHATCSDTNPWVIIEIAPSAVDAHLRLHQLNCENGNRDFEIKDGLTCPPTLSR